MRRTWKRMNFLMSSGSLSAPILLFPMTLWGQDRHCPHLASRGCALLRSQPRKISQLILVRGPTRLMLMFWPSHPPTSNGVKNGEKKRGHCAERRGDEAAMWSIAQTESSFQDCLCNPKPPVNLCVLSSWWWPGKIVAKVPVWC